VIARNLGLLVVLLVVSYLFLLLLLVALIIRSRSKTLTRACALLLAVLLVSPCARDVWVYNRHNKRADRLIRELPKGFSAEKVPEYLDHNKESLGIRWERYEKGEKVWYAVHFEGSFSVLALFRGQGGLVIRLDSGNQTVKEVAWFL